MLTSSSASSQRPPRARPMSAKPSSASSKTAPSARARPEFAPSESDEEEVVDDDDEEEEDSDAEFGAAAEREHERQQQLQRQQQPRPQPQRHRPGKQTPAHTNQGAKQHFRPASAPAGRTKSAMTSLRQQEREDSDDTRQQSAAAISIAYLRAAAEKKKARDREFARELQREESEYRKKITLKIEQANKIMAVIGSSKAFEAAADREGVHMIKVVDRIGGDRVISVEIFLREFEQLATAQLGQTPPLHTGSTSSNTSGRPPTKTSIAASRGSMPPRASRAGRKASSSDMQLEQDGQRPRAARVKPADRTQVQEELKSVLEGTIELTKVLQDQLHELKLKGWNFAGPM